jgi:IS30 family transposase
MKLREYITHHLKLWWSPEEVSGRIWSEIGLHRIWKSSIYNYLRSAHGQLLAMDLDLEKIKKRKKKEKIQIEWGMKLEDRIFIDKRPTSIDERLHFWDWEGDFIVSPKWKKWSLVVLHERKSRFVMIRKIESRTINEVHATIHRMLRIIQTCNSLTLDNDIAFRRHQELSEIIQAPIYFCHAYHSWEKWWVEFSNRLIREFIPKWTDISKVDEDYILNLEVALNNRPRKILSFRTPLEIMQENEQFTTFTDYPWETWREL